MRFTPIFAAAFLCLPADLRAGPSTPPQVTETVTFRLIPGTNEDDFVAAAKDTTEVLKQVGGAFSRTLSKDETGQWTDFIIWTDMDTATNAPAKVMADPSFGVFMSMIQENTVSLEYSTVLWRMD